MLMVDPNNPKAEKLCKKLRKKIDLDSIPLSLVFGGDGWMLDCIRRQGAVHTYMGINAGTLGFLMNDSKNLDAVSEELKNETWKSFSFPRLKITGHDKGGERFVAKAVNDVYFARLLGRAANLRLVIDGTVVVDRLICDGLIVATSLGSTAYSSSAGGSPSHPLIRALHVTPICPHTPRLRSFVVPEDSKITIEALHPERRPVQAVSDGVSHGQVERLEIQRDPEDIRIAFLKEHNFTETMIRKVLRF